MTVTQALKRRDRWADWAVIVLVAVALILGWVLRESILSRTVPFTAGTDVSGRCPATWVRETGTDPLLRVRDPLSGAFGATLELRVRALAAETQPALVLDALALERAREVSAYQTLSTDQVRARGEDATQRTFTYVEVNRNPYLNRLPVVVQGVDLALRDGDRVVVVTFLASAEDFDAYQRYFHAFVESLLY